MKQTSYFIIKYLINIINRCERKYSKMVIFIESIIACLLFTIAVVPSCIRNPLDWIDDYPPAIRKRVKKLGLIKNEKKADLKIIIKKLIFCVVVLLGLSFIVHKFNGANTFIEGVLYSYLLWNIVNWYDAFVIDCIWFCHSKRVIIPGTEDMKEYKDYLFHIRGSFKGMILGLPICLLTGALVLLF